MSVATREAAHFLVGSISRVLLGVCYNEKMARLSKQPQLSITAMAYVQIEM